MKAICVKENSLGFKVGEVYDFNVKDSNVDVLDAERKVINVLHTKVFFMMFNEYIPLDEDKNTYLVFVENNQAPKKIHDTISSAEDEAKRLASLTSNIGKTVSVVKLERIYKSKVIVEKIK